MVLVVVAPKAGDGAASAALRERGAMGMDGERSRYVVSGTDREGMLFVAR